MQKAYDLTADPGWTMFGGQLPEKTVQTIVLRGLPLDEDHWIGKVTHFTDWNFACVMRYLLREILDLGDGPIEYPLGITANVLGNTDANHVMCTVSINYGPNDNGMRPETCWMNHAGQIMLIH